MFVASPRVNLSGDVSARMGAYGRASTMKIDVHVHVDSACIFKEVTLTFPSLYRAL